MEKITDWNSLWRELVEMKDRDRKRRSGAGPHDVWANRAEKFREGVRRRWERPDSSREFILSQLDPDSTVLDIGAGTGSWSILMSKHCRNVTAVEPSGSMISVMRESLSAESITNVSIIQGSWPDVRVEKHDFSLCSHAIYGYADPDSFIRHMAACTRRTCFLLLRAISPHGVRAEAAEHIWGQPHDSPNFTIAYNILLRMGIYANVLMENTGLWRPHTSPTLEDALADMRRFFMLNESGEHDAYLRELLARRLTLKDGKYYWPQEVRSALVYWDV